MTCSHDHQMGFVLFDAILVLFCQRTLRLSEARLPECTTRSKGKTMAQLAAIIGPATGRGRIDKRRLSRSVGPTMRQAGSPIRWAHPPLRTYPTYRGVRTMLRTLTLLSAASRGGLFTHSQARSSPPRLAISLLSGCRNYHQPPAVAQSRNSCTGSHTECSPVCPRLPI